MSLHIEFWFLGPWRAEINGKSAAGLPTRHCRTLLARLALGHPERYTRAEIMDDLFPRLPPSSSARVLRSTIYYIRRSIPDLIITSDNRIGFDPGATVIHDVARFEEESAPGASQASLERAIATYRGHFLENPPDGWAVQIAHQLRGRYLYVLQELVALAQSSGDPASGLDAARRWQEEEPWEENAQIAFIRALISAGHFERAKVQLNRAAALLGADHSLSPVPALQSLARELNRHAADPSRRPEVPLNDELPPRTSNEPSPEYRGPLIGRKSELFVLEHQWAEANRGELRAIIIEGAAGIGKSRLLGEFANRLRFRSEVLIFKGVANERTSYLRLGLFRTAFRSLTAEMVDAIREAVAALDEWSRSRLIQLVPEIRSQIPRQALQSLPEQKETIGITARKQTLMAFLDQLCKQQTTVLAFEDSHFIDNESYDLIQELIQTDRHLLLVFTQQPKISARIFPHAIDLPEDHEKITYLRLPLFRLNESESLVRQVLGNQVEKRISEQLHTWSGGIGIFIKEIIRVLYERGDLVWDASKGWTFRHGDVRLPAQMSDLLQDRMAGLSPAAVEAVQILALINRPVETALLVCLWPDRHKRLEVQAELLAKNLVIDFDQHLMLAHVWLGDTIKAWMDRSALETYHARIARALAALPSNDLIERAHHHDQSGDWEPALDLALTAGHQALVDSRPSELGKILPLIEKCLAKIDSKEADPRHWLFLTLEEGYYAIVERGPKWLRSLERLETTARENSNTGWLVDALTRRGRAERELGKQEAAERSLREAANLARQFAAPAEATARALLSAALDDRGSAKEALFEAELSHQLISDSEDIVARLQIISNLAYMLMRMGQVDHARQALEKIQSDPAIPSRPVLQARLLRQLGIIQIAARDYEIGLDALRRGVRIGRRTGDLQTILICQTSLVYELRRFGLFNEALPLAESTLELARRLKANTQITTILNSLAAIAFHLGELRQAWTLAQESVSAAEATGLPEYLASSLGMQASAALANGLISLALDSIQRAERVMAAIKHPTLLTINHTAARVRLTAGERQHAVESAHSSVQQVVDTGIPAIESIGVLWEAANVLLEVNGQAQAQPIYTRAYRRLIDDMNRLRSIELRQAFLDAHPAHRALLELNVNSSECLVLLPLHGTPTGRPLYMDELAPVVWTVHAPDDLPLSTIPGRQQRLKRLCLQAKEQGALATIEHLARILSVSTRTIQRDLQNLRRAGRNLETYG